MYQVTRLYALNLHNGTRRLYFSNAGGNRTESDGLAVQCTEVGYKEEGRAPTPLLHEELKKEANACNFNGFVSSFVPMGKEVQPESPGPITPILYTEVPVTNSTFLGHWGKARHLSVHSSQPCLAP